MNSFSYKSKISQHVLYLKFGFIIFWRKKIGGNADLKMLIKLTTGYTKDTFIEENYSGRLLAEIRFMGLAEKFY
jgi:hypothetical protein